MFFIHLSRLLFGFIHFVTRIVRPVLDLKSSPILVILIENNFFLFNSDFLFVIIMSNSLTSMRLMGKRMCACFCYHIAFGIFFFSQSLTHILCHFLLHYLISSEPIRNACEWSLSISEFCITSSHHVCHAKCMSVT